MWSRFLSASRARKAQCQPGEHKWDWKHAKHHGYELDVRCGVCGKLVQGLPVMTTPARTPRMQLISTCSPSKLHQTAVVCG